MNQILVNDFSYKVRNGSLISKVSEKIAMERWPYRTDWTREAEEERISEDKVRGFAMTHCLCVSSLNMFMETLLALKMY